MSSENVITNAGTTVAVSDTPPATQDVIGFQAKTYTPIVDITVTDTEPSPDYNEISYLPLDGREERRRKGSFTQASPDYEMGNDPTDVGQRILARAVKPRSAKTDVFHSFEKIDNAGNKAYFKALIKTFVKSEGDADTIVTRNLTLIPENETVVVLVSGIETLGAIVGGTFSTDGTYIATQLSVSPIGGVDAEFEVIVSGGAITTVTIIRESGFGYADADVITLTLPAAAGETVPATIAVGTVNPGLV